MDPLAQLQDIQLPEKIHSYPLAIGWWLIAIICIALIIVITIKVIKHKKVRQAQQKAISEINANKMIEIAECVNVIKWAAMQYFPRERIANLYGESLHHFLLDTLPVNHHEKFKQYSENSLQTMYQKNIDPNENNKFSQASIYWLKHALPPKNNTLPIKELAENKA